MWHDLPNPTQLIFHEKEIRDAQNKLNRLTRIKPEYHRFRSNHYSRMLYSGISTIFSSLSCTVLGSVIHMNELDLYFNRQIQNDSYLTAMQIIMENFSQFLMNNDGVGHVVLESRQEQDKLVRLRFNHIKAMGSMFVSPYAMQTLLKDITFYNKTANEPGLQLADFVPNPFARNTLGISQQKFNNYQSLRGKRYHGGLGKQDRFGMKVMP